MAAGVVHDSVNFGLAAALFASGNPWIGLGMFLSIGISPDLDTRPSNPQKYTQGYFWLYAKLFKHRSFWTHTPIIGTLGRLIYIVALPVLVYAILCLVSLVPSTLQIGIAAAIPQIKDSVIAFVLQYPQPFIRTIMGIELGAIAHYTLDSRIMRPAVKRRR